MAPTRWFARTGRRGVWGIGFRVEVELLFLSLIHDRLLLGGGDEGVVGVALEVDRVGLVGVGENGTLLERGRGGDNGERPIGVGDFLGLEDLAVEGLSDEEGDREGGGGEMAGAGGLWGGLKPALLCLGGCGRRGKCSGCRGDGEGVYS